MITLERMAALEANSEWRGISRYLLMENAGAQTARTIMEHSSSKKKVAIFSGTGNNGGDGFVVARHLVNMGVGVDVFLLGRPRDIYTDDARANWDILSQMRRNVNIRFIRDSKDFDELEVDADVIVDAMLGTGISGELREPAASAVSFINKIEAYKVALDVPTGLDPATGSVQGSAVECDLTVTFHDTKSGLENTKKDVTGYMVVADIGIPKTAEEFAGPGDVQMAVHHRKPTSHKGQNGRVLVIGGGSQYAGAPAHAALAALNTGADLATVAAPAKTAEIVSSFSPDLIALGLPGKDFSPEGIPLLESELEKSPSVVLGPGLGTSDDTEQALFELLNLLVEEYSKVPVLLDADGLKLASKEPKLLSDLECIVTPHTKEFEYLSGFSLSKDQDEKIKQVSKVAEEYDVVILLKSPIDICAGPDGRVILNDTGNPGMTVGGTGDVLAGVVGALISQGADLFRAGAAGLFLNGLAGDICELETGYQFIATDVKDKIPTAILRAKEYW